MISVEQPIFIGSGALAGIARLSLGVQQAASSRYTTISVLLLLSTAVLTGLALASTRVLR